MIERMGKFTAVGMRTKIDDPVSTIINTCSQNDTAERGEYNTWSWANPTNRAITHVLPSDPTIQAVSLEAMWQGTKIFAKDGRPDPLTLGGDWRRGKAKRPIGAWDGPSNPLITSPGEARLKIYIPCFKAQIEHWLKDEIVANWVDQCRRSHTNIYLRDHDTGRGVMRNGPMSHAWVLAMFLNNGVWPTE